MIYYSATEKDEILSLIATWMVLEIIVLDETSQEQEGHMTQNHFYVQANWNWSERNEMWLSEAGERQDIEIEKKLVSKDIPVGKNKLLGCRVGGYSS